MPRKKKEPPFRSVHYMSFTASGPLVIVRVPFPMPRWRLVVQAANKIMRLNNRKASDLYALDGMLPYPDNAKQWSLQDYALSVKLDCAFDAAAKSFPDFQLYDYRGGLFVLVRHALK